MKRKVRRIHWYIREKTRKPTIIPKLSRIKRTAFLISLIILNDLSTIQFRLPFKGHKSLEYCLVLHLTSVSTIYFAESNRVSVFLSLLGFGRRIKTEITCSKKSIVRVQD